MVLPWLFRLFSSIALNIYWQTVLLANLVDLKAVEGNQITVVVRTGAIGIKGVSLTLAAELWLRNTTWICSSAAECHTGVPRGYRLLPFLIRIIRAAVYRYQTYWVSRQ